METLIGMTRTGKRFINYGCIDSIIPENTTYVTIKELPQEIIEAINAETLDEVDNLLSNYI